MDSTTLRAFIEAHSRIFVLTGAGVSTGSGIPDYRDAAGEWKHAAPVKLQEFMGSEAVRRRYWARSLIGWPRLRRALPNAAHHALARLESRGQVELLLTQNVDCLHGVAGSRNVVDLHGRLDSVRCMSCDSRQPRETLQMLLLQLNPAWAGLEARQAPDGDADLGGRDFTSFDVPSCEYCGGILKPDVVFFGESVPAARVGSALQHLSRADAMLVVGSSLMVYSGYRFAQAAATAGLPFAAVNLGRTRADDLLTLKVAQPCAEALRFLLDEPVAA